MDERDIVDACGQIGEQITDPFATFTVLIEFPPRFHDAASVLMAAATEGFQGHRIIVASAMGN